MQELQKPKIIKDLGMMEYGKNGNKTRYIITSCSKCKKEMTMVSGNYKRWSGLCLSCINSIRKTKHGLNNHFLYNTWTNMIQRCYNKNNKSYKNYGGRGIKVCEDWLNVKNFIEFLEKIYIKGYSLDRINVDGDYEPNNIRYTNLNVQAQNTRLLRSDNTSGYRGVSYSKHNKKFGSYICVNNINIFLGYHETKELAAIAYDTYVINNKLSHHRNFN